MLRSVFDRVFDYASLKILSRTGRGSPEPLIDRSSRVPGWLMADEPEFILANARAAPAGDHLEIGSFCGKSASIICGAMDERGHDGALYCVDPFHHAGRAQRSASRNALLSRSRSIKSWFPRLLYNAHRFGFYERLVPLAAHSAHVLRRLNLKFSFAFIDGDHTYEAVREDVSLVVPLLADGAIVLFHDAIGGKFPGVLQALNELIDVDPRFSIRGQAGSIRAYDFRAAA